MNIVKSLHAGVLFKTFSYQRKSIFAVSLLWGFKLDSGEPVLEQKFWTSIGTMLGKNELFDSGMPKEKGEFLAHGSFFPPQGEPVAAGKVSISIGPLRKSLLVFGNRHWIKKLGVVVGMSSAEPILEMPVTYENAFGGKGFEKNPIGRGFFPAEMEDGPRYPLPNIEYPEQVIGSPHARPEPAAYNAIDIMWPQRLSKAGTYDKKYIRDRMPGLPDDIQWNYFNDASIDQQLAGFFEGEESFEIQNMNPKLKLIRGQLPGIYGRCFVNHRIEGQIVFREIKTRLDTVWFFPTDNLGVLIHRGSIEVAEDDGCDITQILIAHESITDNPRRSDFYQEQLTKRLDPEEGFKYMLNTAPLLPKGCRCAFEIIQEESDFKLENLSRQNLESFVESKKQDADAAIQKQKEDIKKNLEETVPHQKNIDIDTIFAGIEQPATADDSPEVKKLKEIAERIAPGAMADPKSLDLTKVDLKGFDDLRVFTDKLVVDKKKEVADKLRAEIDRLSPMKMQHGVPEAIEKLEQSIGELDLPPVLPRFTIDEQMATVRKQYDRQLQQMMVLHSMALPATEMPPIDVSMEDIEKQVSEGLTKTQESYRLGAHYIPEARSPHRGQEKIIAETLLHSFREGRKTAGGDYAFVDLSNKDLSGIDFSNALLEYANLSGANLSHANLTNAVLAHANLSNTNFTDAILVGANLGATNMTETIFIDADLTGAILGKASIKRAVFHRCILVDRMEMFLDTQFEMVDFTGSRMKRNHFINVNISDCNFSDTDLSESNFVNPAMHKTIFDRAIMTSVNFVSAKADEASFKKASMKNVRFVAGCLLNESNFAGAEACEANFRDCQLKNADFSMAHLDKSDFGGAHLQGARFIKSIAVQAQFNKADLTDARLFSMNLMEGSLHKARLTRTQFGGANLYGVNFMGATLGDTDFTDAYLEQTVLKNWEK